MSKAGANNPDKEYAKLIKEIDETVTVEILGKQARLSDAQNTIDVVRADLIGLKRILVQHHRPNAPINELGGQPLNQAIREKVAQIKRLAAYIDEIEALPDDPESELADASGDEGLQDDELDAKLPETKVTHDG